MKHNVLLPVTSLLLILLISFHLTDDFVYGKEATSPSLFLTAVLILFVWLYGALVLAGKRSGYIITLIGSLLALGIPYFHISGPAGVVGETARASGPFFFVWTMLALDAAALFTVILSVHGLWSLRRSAST